MEGHKFGRDLRHPEVLGHKLKVGFKPDSPPVVREAHAFLVDRESMDVPDTLSRSQGNQQDRPEAKGPNVRRLQHGGLHNPSRTTARSQSGNSGLSVAVARLTPFKKGDQGMLSDRLASVSGVTSKDGSQIDHNSRVGEAFAKPALQEPKDLTNRCLGRHQPGD